MFIENGTGKFPSVGTVSTDNPSTDPLLHIMALERHLTITISLDVDIIYLRITGFLDFVHCLVF
jgi:hypothetical protein